MDWLFLDREGKLTGYTGTLGKWIGYPEIEKVN